MHILCSSLSLASSTFNFTLMSFWIFFHTRACAAITLAPACFSPQTCLSLYNQVWSHLTRSVSHLTHLHIHKPIDSIVFNTLGLDGDLLVWCCGAAGSKRKRPGLLFLMFLFASLQVSNIFVLLCTRFPWKYTAALFIQPGGSSYWEPEFSLIIRGPAGDGRLSRVLRTSSKFRGEVL